MKNRKNEIIEAARKRFARHGFRKTSVEEIARDLRIGKATIYHYFNSKMDLFYDTVSADINNIIDSISSIFNNESLTIKNRLQNFVSLKRSLNDNYSLIFQLVRNNFSDLRLEEERELFNTLLYKEISIVKLFISSTSTLPEDRILEFTKIFVIQSYTISFINEFESINDGLSIDLMANSITNYFEKLIFS
ncbi:MAG: TetR/AcrR family transcriptional regulator [Ignavibacteriaceae bacterium]|nr:TetR/AcrR family transcriptional regulator [Ignavibacteriaceae bacterium]